MEKCSPDDDVNILLFSAKTEYSLNRTAERIMEHLTQQPELSVSNAAWTLQSGRSIFAYRKALILDKTWKDNPDKLLQQLGKARVYQSAQETRPVYFMFPDRAVSIREWVQNYTDLQSKPAWLQSSEVIFRTYWTFCPLKNEKICFPLYTGISSLSE